MNRREIEVPEGEAMPLEWPDAQPLTAKIDPEPYPIDALPETIRGAVIEVQQFVQAPVSLVASSALSAVSLSAQAHVDIERARRLSGPVGLFFLTIADSGERKSTCDGFFTSGIRDYEAKQQEAAKPLIQAHMAALESWESRRNGTRDAIKAAAKAGEDTADFEERMKGLAEEEPQPPRVPRLIYTDATPEALKWGLGKGWPSGGVLSSEGGIVFGSHGMNKESLMRNLATMNQLWDGADIPTERRSTESFTVRGARFTIAIQVQEATLRSFYGQSGDLARGTGFMARFLFAWPGSTQGTRQFVEPPEHWPELSKFNRRIASILNQPVPITESGALVPPSFTFSPQAKAEWIVFHDRIECQLAVGGKLHDVRDVASKTADNAARLAALFHVFEDVPGQEVGLASFSSASRIVKWHLNEGRRFFGEMALPKGLADAARLDSWLVSWCRRQGPGVFEVPTKEIQQYGPSGLREKAAIEAAVSELEDLGRAQRLQKGKRKFIAVNPSLLAPEAIATAIPATAATNMPMIGSTNSNNSGSSTPISGDGEECSPLTNDGDWDDSEPFEV